MPATLAPTADRELAHALMVVLRVRYETGTGRRVFRGESPHAIGRGTAPRASAALLDARTSRLLVAAEAIDASVSTGSVDRARERAAVLADYVRARHHAGDDKSLAPEIWICAPRVELASLAQMHPIEGVTWVPYEPAPTRVAALELTPHERTLARLDAHVREVDALIDRREAATNRSVALRADAEALRQRVGRANAKFRYSREALEATLHESAKISADYLSLRADLSRRKP